MAVMEGKKATLQVRLRPSSSPRPVWTCLSCWRRQRGQGLPEELALCWLPCWTM